MTLNTASPLPLYQQLAERIRSDVENGVYTVGEKIPSEHQLAAQYGIGRPTVRQATDLLVRQGLLQRRRGAGTFVLPEKQQIDLLSLAGTSAALQQTELDAQIELITPPTLLTESQYRHSSISGKTYYLQRLSRVEQTPVLLEKLYLDADLFYDFTQHTIDGRSLSRFVRDVYCLEASSAEQSFSIYCADNTTAQLLQVDTQTPLLHVGRTLNFGEQRSGIYCDIYCRTERFHFSQTIYNNQHPSAYTEGTIL